MDIVYVWLIRLDVPEHIVDRLSTVLDEDERRRAGALLLPYHRRRFTAAHGAARVILGRHLGVPASSIRWTHGPHGKPALAGSAGVEVNLSHSGGLALLALSRHRPVGVDVQRMFPVDAVRLAARYFPAAEARFVRAGPQPATRFARLWTRKEACVKAAGARLAQGLRLPVRGTGGIVVRGTGRALPGPYHVRDVPVPAGFLAAVALDGAAGFRQVVRSASVGDSRAARAAG